MVEGYFETDKFLSENDLTKYYSQIFNMHFIYWITSLVFSDISDGEKTDLISDINELLKKDVKLVPGFGERIYSSLTNPILDDDYEKVVKSINSIRRYRNILIYLPNKYFRLRGG